jgi:hypothetical protein
MSPNRKRTDFQLPQLLGHRTMRRGRGNQDERRTWGERERNSRRAIVRMRENQRLCHPRSNRRKTRRQALSRQGTPNLPGLREMEDPHGISRRRRSTNAGLWNAPCVSTARRIHVRLRTPPSLRIAPMPKLVGCKYPLHDTSRRDPIFGHCGTGAYRRPIHRARFGTGSPTISAMRTRPLTDPSRGSPGDPMKAAYQPSARRSEAVTLATLHGKQSAPQRRVQAKNSLGPAARSRKSKNERRNRAQRSGPSGFTEAYGKTKLLFGDVWGKTSTLAPSEMPPTIAFAVVTQTQSHPKGTSPTDPNCHVEGLASNLRLDVLDVWRRSLEFLNSLVPQLGDSAT